MCFFFLSFYDGDIKFGHVTSSTRSFLHLIGFVTHLFFL